MVSRADRFLEVGIEFVGVEEDEGAELVTAEVDTVLASPGVQG